MNAPRRNRYEDIKLLRWLQHRRKATVALVNKLMRSVRVVQPRGVSFDMRKAFTGT